VRRLKRRKRNFNHTKWNFRQNTVLTKKGFNQLSLDTEAVVSMDGLSIKGVYLTITGKVLGISTDEFNEITNVAKKYLYNYRNIEHSYQY